MPDIQLPYTVPYTAQIASPELATAIFVQGMNPTLDPRWHETGAASPEEYAYWVERACGIACVKMCVEALGGPRRTLMEWIQAGLKRNGYLIVEENGQPQELGWIHQALADLIAGAGFAARPAPASVADIVAHLRQERMVIASVSYEVGDDLPVTRKGGHLVVVTGADLDDRGAPTHLYTNNPSGRRLELQVNAPIPVERFLLGYSGRIIVAARRL